MTMKFTKTEMNYLRWLHESHDCKYSDQFCDDCHFISVLSECFVDEQIVYSKELPFKADRRALRNLKKAGMLHEESTIHYGLEWYSFWLSDKGQKFMESQA